jgi:integrase
MAGRRGRQGRQRGNGEGTIYKREVRDKATGTVIDERWLAQMTLPDGKRKSFYGKTRQEVAAKLTAALRDKARGVMPAPERQTVRDYLSSWLAANKARLEPGTWLRYEQYARLHIVPFLGRVRLAALTPQHLQSLYAAKLEGGLSPTTVNHLHTALHTALEAAGRLGLVGRNVADLVDPPRKVSREMRVYTPEQARALLEAVSGAREEALYTLALFTGMREGELLGLGWEYVRLAEGYLTVQVALKNVNNRRWLGKPKTEAGRRKIVLAPSVIAALRAHRARQLQERLVAGDGWQDNGLVFCTHTGGHIAGSNLRMAHMRLLRRLQLPYMRFHDLRHTAATLLLLQGAPVKVVSEMLGHANVGITMNLYMHVLPTMQQAAAEAMEAVLRSNTKSS